MSTIGKPNDSGESFTARIQKEGKGNSSPGGGKIISIGDLHGSQAWKKINPGEWDRIIFVGDYVDSLYFSDDEILQNLQSLLDFKKSFPDKVILLWGNHDLAYFYGGHERHYASGFKAGMLLHYFNLYTANRRLFQAAFGIGNYLWTHAGVIQQWYDENIAGEMKSITAGIKSGLEYRLQGQGISSNGLTPIDAELATTLNRLFDQYYLPLFNVGVLRGGLYNEGGIFWADKRELEDDPLKGYHQMVGHNKTRSGIRVSNHFGDDTSITWLDCLETATEFYQLIIK